MMDRLRESKWVYGLMSVLLAFVFWLYVRTDQDPTGEMTLRNIPVQTSGANVLTQQGLTVSGLSAETVSLRVQAPASVQDALYQNREDISVTVDVSRCTEGENQLSYVINLPQSINRDAVTFLDQSPDTITVTVDTLYTSTLPVEFQLEGSVAEGYQTGVTSIKQDPTTGAIVSVVVVGRANINRGLPSVQAERQASRAAQLNAQGEFRQWLHAKTRMVASDNLTVAVYTKGEADGELGAASAQTKTDTKQITKEQVKTVAEGFVRGLQQIAAGVNARGQFVAVYGWSAARTKALDGGQGGAAQRQGQQQKPGNLKPVRQGKSVSDDAALFF